MEVHLARKEIIFDGKKYEPEYVAKYELIDGGPCKNDRIPIRFFLKSYNLTPSYQNIEGIFAVKYFLNLIVVDDSNYKYFKMAEVNLHRLFRDRRAHFQDFENDGLFVSEPFFEDEYSFVPNTNDNNYGNDNYNNDNYNNDNYNNNNYNNNNYNDNYGYGNRDINNNRNNNNKNRYDYEDNNLIMNAPNNNSSLRSGNPNRNNRNDV